MESETDHQEVLKVGAVVEQVEGRKKRQRGRNLAARRRRTDPVGNWPPPTEGRPADLKWHGARETSSGKSGPWRTWYEKTRKNGKSGGDNWGQ
jgi:hypothetical protein